MATGRTKKRYSAARSGGSSGLQALAAHSSPPESLHASPVSRLTRHLGKSVDTRPAKVVIKRINLVLFICYRFSGGMMGSRGWGHFFVGKGEGRSGQLWADLAAFSI
jgi:hypothetical protein